MLHKLYILNVPIFFEAIWETELNKYLDNDTKNKIIMSSQCSNKDLLLQVDELDLPLIYGGNC
jgi:hypothetical protein